MGRRPTARGKRWWHIYRVWKPRRGQKCWVCYDGKWGRRVEGKILKHHGGSLTVEFVPYCSDDDKPVRFRVNRGRGGSWGGWLIEDFNLMTALFGSKRCPGDWYSVYEFTEEA